MLLHQNTDWGKTTADLFEGKAKELGAQIVYRDAYLPDEKDFKTIVTKARDANPDGLALMSYYTDAALIAQQARAQGLNVDIIANGATYSPKFIELGGAAVEGAATTSTWFSGNPRPEVQEFVKKYKEQYNEEPELVRRQRLRRDHDSGERHRQGRDGPQGDPRRHGRPEGRPEPGLRDGLVRRRPPRR